MGGGNKWEVGREQMGKNAMTRASGTATDKGLGNVFRDSRSEVGEGGNLIFSREAFSHHLAPTVRKGRVY